MLKESTEKGIWIVKGFLTAGECFRCKNHLEHKVEGRKVSIHCHDPCHFGLKEKIKNSR